MPLMMARQGEQLIIKDIKARRGQQRRLNDMGLRINDEIEIIASRGRGHFVIAVQGKRFVLCPGMSQTIFVGPIVEFINE